MNLPIWIFQSWERLGEYENRAKEPLPLFPLEEEAFWVHRHLHWGGTDISGITQQDLPALPLDFETHVYKYARILLHIPITFG